MRVCERVLQLISKPNLFGRKTAISPVRSAREDRKLDRNGMKKKNVLNESCLYKNIIYVRTETLSTRARNIVFRNIAAYYSVV